MTRIRPASIVTLALTLALLGLLLSACAPDGGASPSQAHGGRGDAGGVSGVGDEPAGSPPDRAAIDIAGFRFEPSEIRIAVGGNVEWVNRDSFDHTATATGTGATFDSGPLGRGDPFEHTFAQAGTLTYFCTIHNYMQATVVVG